MSRGEEATRIEADPPPGQASLKEKRPKRRFDLDRDLETKHSLSSSFCALRDFGQAVIVC